MTTTRLDVLLLLAVTGTFALCLVEAATGHFWCSAVFGLLAVACAGMFLWQVERHRPVDVRHPWQWHVEHRRFWLQVIRSERDWTWRVKR